MAGTKDPSMVGYIDRYIYKSCSIEAHIYIYIYKSSLFRSYIEAPVWRLLDRRLLCRGSSVVAPIYRGALMEAPTQRLLCGGTHMEAHL